MHFHKNPAGLFIGISDETHCIMTMMMGDDGHSKSLTTEHFNWDEAGIKGYQTQKAIFEELPLVDEDESERIQTALTEVIECAKAHLH